MIQAVKDGKRRFGNDPNFRPDLVPGYFVPRLVDGPDDVLILKRIIAAYKKAKIMQKSSGEAFNVSNEWLPIYERQLGPVMKALLSEDLTELRRMYQNFFRDPCSTGLVGLPIKIPNLFSGGGIKQKFREYIACDVAHRYDLWQSRTGSKYTAAALSAPMVGNPYGYTMGDVFIRAGGDYQHYYAHAIAELAASSEDRTVVELGGGFGGLAYYLVRDNPQVTYVDFDLPEATALASYYLMRCLPNVPIRLYGEAELSADVLATPGFVMMPSFEIMKMPSKSAAVSFNSYSLAEMAPAAIGVYLDEIARITCGYFLHVNHNRNAVLSADNFGVEDRGFKLLNRQLAGWTLGINPQSDEYEYLYEA
ncbi:MAG TPA: putative sugar O-methyltransferase [Candidatus Sulfotelmatobacter sp.]|jgi:putative sugar O-methyltransferase|nr:putative sugar O-methyltransferase [Candidatus Sulfotelmatobacter sp.]